MACADEPIPANAGCYRPVTVRTREGSIVHARHPAPVANRITVTHRLATTLLGALHQAVPERIPAAYYGVSYVFTFQTIADDGERNVLVEIEVGGTGGASAAGRVERLLRRHAQQRQHPGRDDRERAAAHHHALRRPARHRRRRPVPRRARPRPRVAGRLQGGGFHRQPRALQVPPLRARGRPAAAPGTAHADARRRRGSAPLQDRQLPPAPGRRHPARDLRRRRLRRPGRPRPGRNQSDRNNGYTT